MIISDIFSSILLPPGLNLLLAVVGIFGLKKFRITALSLLYLAGSSLLILSTPIVAVSLLQQLESEEALTSSQIRDLNNAQANTRAIVVISGGRLSLAPEYGNIDTVNEATLQRLRYASWLHKRTNLPILLSGGTKNDEATSEAVLMNQTMISSFDIAPSWIESQSRNITESAYFVSQLLKNHKISEVLLVTHAWHMSRALQAFERQGLTIIPAPMAYSGQSVQTSNFLLFVPSAQALADSSHALREIIGKFWGNLFN